MTGNFHHNSETDRFNLKRREEGGGVKKIKESYVTKILGLKRNIERDRDKNYFKENVYHHGKERTVSKIRQNERLYIS